MRKRAKLQTFENATISQFYFQASKTRVASYGSHPTLTTITTTTTWTSFLSSQEAQTPRSLTGQDVRLNHRHLPQRCPPPWLPWTTASRASTTTFPPPSPPCPTLSRSISSSTSWRPRLPQPGACPPPQWCRPQCRCMATQATSAEQPNRAVVGHCQGQRQPSTRSRPRWSTTLMWQTCRRTTWPTCRCRSPTSVPARSSWRLVRPRRLPDSQPPREKPKRGQHPEACWQLRVDRATGPLATWWRTSAPCSPTSPTSWTACSARIVSLSESLVLEQWDRV